MAKTVTVNLTKKDLQILRRLIVQEAMRNNYNKYQRRSEMPVGLRNLDTVARKIWEARQAIDVV